MYGVDHLQVFPISIFRTQIYDNDKLKKYLVEDILDSVDDLSIPKDWSTDRILTSFGTDSEIIDRNKTLLEREYRNCILDIFDREVDFNFLDMWYNVYRDGEYQEEHDHLGNPFYHSHFSFIHFLSFDNTIHRPPEFKDPLAQIRNLCFELESTGCKELYIPRVSEGEVLMFPSYLMHCVRPSKPSDYPRITISFNISVTRYGEETGSN